MALEFNFPKYFQERGIRWDAAQQLLGWPSGSRRHALRRFVEGDGRLSLGEINDLMQYIYEHSANWLDYIAPPNLLQLISQSGRVRMFVVGGTQDDELRDDSSMFDLLAMSYVNANLPRTTWHTVRCDIEPCRIGLVRPDAEASMLDRLRIGEASQWQISFGSSKVSRGTTLLLEHIYGKRPSQAPEPEPIVQRLRTRADRPLAPTRFVETVGDEAAQGIAIAGGKAFSYQPPGAQPGRDVGLIVSQSEANGRGGRVVVAGVSGTGTYAAALGLVQCADLLAPARHLSGPRLRMSDARYDTRPIVGVVEARVEHEPGAAPARLVTEARLVYCSGQSDISPDQPVELTVPRQAGIDVD